ncbi:MAG: sugar ABC transporter permease YjfF [Faecalibacterium sp.]|jgi:simple sugar transport system permease protein|nr:sugar ABC transporter permease YjfF [Faecalibacterium sp.]
MNTKLKKQRIGGNQLLLYITMALFVVMYLVGCILYSGKGFTHLQTFLNLFITNAGLVCVACGLTVVMLTGGIDISVGSLVALDCMLLAYGTSTLGIPAVVMLGICLVFGILFGLWQGFLVGYLGIQPFIVTMAGLYFCRGLTACICSDQLSIDDPVLSALANIKITLPFGGYVNNKGKQMLPFLRVTVLVAIVVLVAIFLLLKYTKFGRSLYAVGGSEQSAKMMGLNTRRTKLLAYTLSSTLCSIGGILYALNTMQASVQQAKGFEMDAIASSVIGGTLLTGGVGNVVGTLFGVMINGTISTIIKTNGKLLSSWANIATAALLCFFIILQAVFAALKEKNK